jgi:hypothetical protein
VATIDRPTLITSFGSGLSVPGDAATGHVKREIVDWMENLYPQDFPIYTMIKSGKTLRQNKVEWGSGAELHHSASLLTSIAASAAVVTVVLNSGEGDRFQVGNAIAMYERDANGVPQESTKEIMLITAISTDTLTVVREQGGTTAVAFTGGTTDTGAYVHNLGTALVEGADFTVSPHVFGDFYYNYFQTFQRGHKISKEANQQDNWEFDDNNHIARLMTDAALRAKRQVNDALVRGGRQAGTQSVPSMLGGFPSFVPSENRTNLNGNKLSLYDIEAEGAALWETVGGKAAKKLFMSMRTARYFDAAMNKYREATMKDTSASLKMTSFDTRFGEFDVEAVRGWPEGLVVGANVNNMSRHPLQGMDWQELEHPVHGAYIHRSVYGRFTLVVRAPETMFSIYGFDSNFTNYGRVF